MELGDRHECALYRRPRRGPGTAATDYSLSQLGCRKEVSRSGADGCEVTLPVQQHGEQCNPEEGVAQRAERLA